MVYLLPLFVLSGLLVVCKLSVMITTKGFLIADPFHDESVGIYPQSWEVKGHFDFDNQEEFDEFTMSLQAAFDLVCGDLPVICTLEDVEAEVKRENEMEARMEEYYNREFDEDDFYDTDNGPTGHGDSCYSDADSGL